MAAYQRVCGIDVAKETLEVCLLGGDQPRRLSPSNDARGFAEITTFCQKQQVQIVVLEATGGYQRALVRALAEAKLPVAVVNPGRVRHYALAEGLLAKTDQVDAQMIAGYGLKLVPKPTALRTAEQQELQALVARKAQWLQGKVAEENRLQQSSSAFVRQGIGRHLRLIEREIGKLDARLDELVEQDPQLQEKAKAADSVKGVGRASAVALVSLMPELGSLTRRQVASLAGLAPFNQDSGKQSGPRHIFGGRAPVRTVLYMCVLSVIRREGVLKSFYDRLIENGKCPMQAITAAMRKLLVIVNARIREAQASVPEPSQARTAAVAAAGG
jgi:transposase